MKNLNWLVAASAVTMAACSGTGGTGAITGSITVAGQKRADVSVDLLGPVTRGAVSDANGAFTFNGLPDGDFVVRATVPGTREGTRVASVQVKGGKSSGEAALSFTTDAPVTISGHVVFSDGSDASGIVVTAAGAVTKVTTTEVGGAFSFAGLPPGGYVISADVGDTREQRISLGANAVADLDVGNLTFTPSGKLAGTVSFNGAPAAGVQIVVTGTSLAAVSGAEGQFEFSGVPTGTQTLLARVGEAPFYRSATASLTVARGANTDVALELTDAPLPTGTVRGKIFFEAGAASPTRITVSASGVSATPSANGEFSLELPIGRHLLTATAPHYPVQVIGQVTVGANETHWLAQSALSYFTPIFSNPNAVIYVEEVVHDDWRAPPTHGYQLLALCDDFVIDQWGEWSDCLAHSLRVLNLATSELTPIYFGEWYGAALSPNGDLAAWVGDGAVWTYSIATREVRAYPMLDDASWHFNQAHFGVDDGYIYFGDDYYRWSREGTGLYSGGPGLYFDADGRHLSFARHFYVESYVNGSFGYSYGGGRVTRISLSDGAQASTPDPTTSGSSIDFGFSSDIAYRGEGQWTWQELETDGGVTLRQLNATGVSTVFEGRVSYGADPLPYDFRSLDDGGVQLSVLPVNAVAPVVVQGVSGNMSLDNLWGEGSYPTARVFEGLEDGGAREHVYLITPSTGATYDLGPGLLGTLASPAGTAVLYANATTTEDGGWSIAVRLLPLPPAGQPALLAEGPSVDEPHWLSNSTVMFPRAPADADAGYELTFFTNGTTSTLVGVPGASPRWGGGAVALRTADGWRAQVGDRNVALPAPASVDLEVACAPSASPWADTSPVAAFYVRDGRDGFVSINSTTGAASSFPLSSMSECGRVGAEVLSTGSSYLNGSNEGAIFFLVSSDTIYWRGGIWATVEDESRFVGSERQGGLVQRSADGHTLGYARFH